MDWFHLQQDLHSSLQLCTDLFRPMDSPETLSVYERVLTTNPQQVVNRHVHFKQICEFSKSGGQLISVSYDSVRTNFEEDGPVLATRKTVLYFCREDVNFAMQIIKGKKKAWQDICSETGRDGHWHLYRQVVRPQGPVQVEDLDNGNDRITSDEGKAEMLAATFSRRYLLVKMLNIFALRGSKVQRKGLLRVRSLPSSKQNF